MAGKGCAKSLDDPCVYHKEIPSREYVYLLWYVDDLIVSRSRLADDKLKKQLSAEIEMNDLGEAKKIPSMEIVRDRLKGRVSLTWKQYLQRCFRSSILVVIRSL